IMKNLTLPLLSSATLAISLAVATPVFAQGPVAAAPYQLKVFANAPSGLSAPASVAVLKDHVFFGCGDRHLPGCSDGRKNQGVEYKMAGAVVFPYPVPGHNDGLKVDPSTHL